MKQQHSDEHKAKIAESVKRYYADPANRKANSQRVRAYNAKVKAALEAYEAEQQQQRGGGSSG